MTSARYEGLLRKASACRVARGSHMDATVFDVLNQRDLAQDVYDCITEPVIAV